MKSEFDEVGYKLSWDVEHYERCGLDWKEDLLIEKYDGYASYKYFEREPFNHPTPVIFQGDLDVIRYTDYPQANNDWNVMSRKMYDVLCAVGDFPHRIIPVVIVNWEVQRKDWCDERGELRKEICLWNYLAVQVTEHLDIFDYEKSRFTTYEDDPNKISMISEYVFKIPQNGLPPIFKISAENYHTFVSAEAREAMKQAKITGTRYQLLRALGTTFVDNLIVLPPEFYI